VRVREFVLLFILLFTQYWKSGFFFVSFLFQSFFFFSFLVFSWSLLSPVPGALCKSAKRRKRAAWDLWEIASHLHRSLVCCACPPSGRKEESKIWSSGTNLHSSFWVEVC
jgi:hypothetical protein